MALDASHDKSQYFNRGGISIPSEESSCIPEEPNQTIYPARSCQSKASAQLVADPEFQRLTSPRIDLPIGSVEIDSLVNEPEHGEALVGSCCTHDQPPEPPALAHNYGSDPRRPGSMAYCANCQEYMCTECASRHSDMTASRDHYIHAVGSDFDLSKFLTSRWFKCEIHNTRDAQVHCSDCSSFFCVLCLRSHHNHNYQDIVKSAERIRRQMEEELKILKCRHKRDGNG